MVRFFIAPLFYSRPASPHGARSQVMGCEVSGAGLIPSLPAGSAAGTAAEFRAGPTESRIVSHIAFTAISENRERPVGPPPTTAGIAAPRRSPLAAVYIQTKPTNAGSVPTKGRC